MFTGIVEGMGKFVGINKTSSPVLLIEYDLKQELKIGDSIAINGSCLTLIEKKDNLLSFNLSRESLKLTNISDQNKGSYVNVELPLKMSDFLGGHLVSGHVDGVVRVRKINKSSESTKFSFTYTNRDWRKYLIPKGSVTLNGVSLTLTEISSSFFSVELIPHTLSNTNFQYMKIGQRVNLELDLIAKYLYNLN